MKITTMMHNKNNNKGFTILELMIAMTLFIMTLTMVINSVQNLSFSRISTLNRVSLLDELYFFSEQLFTSIKDGGTVDYEEYWNRMAVGMSMSTSPSWGHYAVPTGVGNYGPNGTLATTAYGSSLYLCRSGLGMSIATQGCLMSNNNGIDWYSPGASLNFSGTYQRYGQYYNQFTDYNGNGDSDLGDEDGDGNIVGDDDDFAIGDAPSVLSGTTTELYLINKNQKTRTFFRWNIKQDPNSPAGVVCSVTMPTPGKIQTNSGCIGNIQVLKLQGVDIGLLHTGSLSSDKTAYDGKIDTWLCNTNWSGCTGPTVPGGGILATGRDGEWIDLFPSSINVRRLSFQVYPIKDPWLSWGSPDAAQSSTDISPFIHPYVRMNLEMGFSWQRKLQLNNNQDPTIAIATSISLSDFE